MTHETIEQATERIKRENLKTFAIAFAFFVGQKEYGTFGKLYDRWLQEEGKDYIEAMTK